MNDTVMWQRIEGLVVFAAALIYYSYLGAGFPIWLGILIFFAPDLSFVAYGAGPKIGAFVYNVVHVYALGAVMLVTGLLMPDTTVTAIGALLLAHTGFDRALGYGLKSTTGFKHTHLGTL
ncbi:MAG: DUF4260 domain-containing protein [Cognatishimia sp.]|uniref:DUF4260 domain-containing protein n=1 Tax=Cognatishimia sp. TaxID=2211648 RepID=UPI004058FDFC